MASINNSESEKPESSTWRLAEWFSDLNPDQLGLFKKYFDEIKKYNKTINLVSPKTLSSADLTHFADCILASRSIRKGMPSQVKEVFDIGSGNGFPGMVFAVLFPEVKVNLVESDLRKSEFLKNLVITLGLKNVHVLNQNVETLKDRSVSVAISRGFAPLSKAILVTRKIFIKGGVYFHLKGEEWASEIASIPSQLCSFWLPGLVGEYRLPVGEVKFAVVKTDKIND